MKQYSDAMRKKIVTLHIQDGRTLKSLAAEYGVKAIVQPGGSVRDEDSVKKANECGITMLCTGMRHFKH